MTARTTLASALTIGLFAAAGCIDYNQPLEILDDAVPETLAPWSLDFPQGCLEGGFIAPSKMEEGQILVEPWVRKDIRPELNDPTLTQAGTGPISANWHQGFSCPSVVRDGVVVEDFIWGWVGQMVEAPPWDPGGADLQFHLTGFGLANGTIRDALLPDTLLDVTQTYEASVTPVAPGSPYVDIFMRDVTKGTYEGHGPVWPFRDVEERVIRFWWYVPVDGTRSNLAHIHGEDIPNPTAPADDHGAMDAEAMDWNPVYFDLHTGGGQQMVSNQGLNPSSHNGGDAHGGAKFYLPEITVVYEHKSLEITSSHVYKDIVLKDYFWH